MTEVSTPSAIDMSLGKTSAPDGSSKAPKVRPERPDEEAYKADLANAEKAHATAMEKFVCQTTFG